MIRKIKIVPAILTDDIKSFERMIDQAATFADFIQVDIMDGQFVPSKSITALDIANLRIKTSWEAHLMVKHPLSQLNGFKKAGAGRVVFHYECLDSPLEVISKARDTGLKIGMAICPETPVSAFFKLSEKVDSLLFLTVNPGFYGSPFLPQVLTKVKETRSKNADIEIGVDGGIKAENLVHVAKAGVDYICVGSGIMMQPNPAQAYEQLLSKLRAQSTNTLEL